ncbi:unnamed protein product [Schistosoma rodhaini]|uniref:Secreted protein n=1 Tax=Schistosoma mansoni TaxID=6183 RepID=A0A5K4F6L1_SCHMA|nr:unnamed protein product [Schistosoma rodhaini]
MNRLMSFTLLVCLILIGLPEKQAHLQSRHGLVSYDVPFTCWKCKCHLALLGDVSRFVFHMNIVIYQCNLTH